MQFLTLINRTSKSLHGVWDGKHIDIAPGKHSFPEVQALKYKDQNPLMGSQDPFTNQMDYLIGIEELGDDCSPLEQSAAIELWNRGRLGGGPVQVVPGKAGLYANERQSALPSDSTFVKP